MIDIRQRANALMCQAEKKLRSFSLFGLWTQSHREHAAELYSRAAEFYRMAKCWSQAGDAYGRAAGCHEQLQAPLEAASAYALAAHCWRKDDGGDGPAATCLVRATELYADEGRFLLVARHHRELAELREDAGDLEDAAASYQRAADGYEDGSNADGCLRKVASLSARLERYDRAIELFEQLARRSLDVALLRFGAKQHLLCATLCRLARGDEAADVGRAVERYCDTDASFPQCREHKFLEDLIAALGRGDAEAFATAVAGYDGVTHLDAWKTTLLLRIRATLDRAESLV